MPDSISDEDLKILNEVKDQMERMADDEDQSKMNPNPKKKKFYSWLMLRVVSMIGKVYV